MGDRRIADIGVGDQVEFTNGPAGRVRRITTFSPYRVMFTLDTDRCVDMDPTTDEITFLGPHWYRVAPVGDD